MLRFLVATSLKFRFLVVAAALAMVIFGADALRRMPVDVFPEFAPPLVEIQTPSRSGSWIAYRDAPFSAWSCAHTGVPCDGTCCHVGELATRGGAAIRGRPAPAESRVECASGRLRP